MKHRVHMRKQYKIKPNVRLCASESLVEETNSVSCLRNFLFIMLLNTHNKRGRELSPFSGE